MINLIDFLPSPSPNLRISTKQSPRENPAQGFFKEKFKTAHKIQRCSVEENILVGMRQMSAFAEKG